EALDVGGRKARDARSLVAIALLVDEGAAVGQVAGCVLDLAQPGEALRRLRAGRAGDHAKRAERRSESPGEPPDHLPDPAGWSATVRTYGTMPCSDTRGEKP